MLRNGPPKFGGHSDKESGMEENTVQISVFSGDGRSKKWVDISPNPSRGPIPEESFLVVRVTEPRGRIRISLDGFLSKFKDNFPSDVVDEVKLLLKPEPRFRLKLWPLRLCKE